MWSGVEGKGRGIHTLGSASRTRTAADAVVMRRKRVTGWKTSIFLFCEKGCYVYERKDQVFDCGKDNWIEMEWKDGRRLGGLM